MQQAAARSSQNEQELMAVGTAQNTQQMKQKQYKAASTIYQREQYRNLSPVEVIKKLYDVALLSIRKGNTQLAQQAISELVCGLNFDYPEVSVGLFQLYQYAKGCIRSGNNQEAIRVLEELRSAWTQAFHLENK